jgi:predicted DNA-binding transcriptional regulator AlpA
MTEALKLYDQNEAAKLLSLSPRTLRHFRAQGVGPAFVRIGKRRVGYSYSALESWIEQRTVPQRQSGSDRLAA